MLRMFALAAFPLNSLLVAVLILDRTNQVGEVFNRIFVAAIHAEGDPLTSKGPRSRPMVACPLHFFRKLSCAHLWIRKRRRGAAIRSVDCMGSAPSEA